MRMIRTVGVRQAAVVEAVSTATIIITFLLNHTMLLHAKSERRSFRCRLILRNLKSASHAFVCSSPDDFAFVIIGTAEKMKTRQCLNY